ncbi:hypothetical protein BU17DRAFT_68560 [Hysterangium stoloniferum]|nr:hypothetical protein BU17DRAFT_68560 [Hysterangium stoloniferum]
METTRPAALFFDLGLPPAALPILTSHTELHSVLDATHVSTPKAHARTHPKNPVRPRERDIHINPHDDEDEGAALDDMEAMLRLSIASNNEVSNNPDTKIPKPDGEPGRPGCWGYNLQHALNWNVSAYNKLKTNENFPELDNYVNCWPVDDMIKMWLKYTSSRARLKELKKVSGRNMIRSKNYMETPHLRMYMSDTLKYQRLGDNELKHVRATPNCLWNVMECGTDLRALMPLTHLQNLYVRQRIVDAEVAMLFEEKCIVVNVIPS